MSLFKSLFSGVGTGAGVAWPLFGIAFSAIGSSIGGVVSLALGGVTIGLFSGITAFVIYSSYKKMEAEEQLQQKLINKNEDKLIASVQKYFSIKQSSTAKHALDWNTITCLCS